MTTEEIDAIAKSMPGGIDGFLKGWGWQQFAQAVLEAADKDYAKNRERADFAVAMCRDAQEMASAYGGALLVIAQMPIPEQDNMLSANMRKVASETLRGSISVSASKPVTASKSA